MAATTRLIIIDCPHCNQTIQIEMGRPYVGELPQAGHSPTWPKGMELKAGTLPTNVVDMRKYGYKQRIERLDDETGEE